MNDDESFQRATSAALRLLSHRPRSEAEVRARLMRRFPGDVVGRVIESLLAQGQLNDSDFAALWRDSRVSFRPRSAAAIRRELVQKGVARDIADTAVHGLDDLANAYRAGLSHARRLGQVDYHTFRRRMWEYLQRRGFSTSVARRTIVRLWEDREQGRHPADDDAQGG